MSRRPWVHRSDELAALLLKIGNGDRGAFTAFYDATSAQLYGAVTAALTDPTRAESVLSHVYGQVWRGDATYDDKAVGGVHTWLNTLACRQVIRPV